MTRKSKAKQERWRVYKGRAGGIWAFRGRAARFYYHNHYTGRPAWNENDCKTTSFVKQLHGAARATALLKLKLVRVRSKPKSSRGGRK